MQRNMGGGGGVTQVNSLLSRYLEYSQHLCICYFRAGALTALDPRSHQTVKSGFKAHSAFSQSVEFLGIIKCSSAISRCF